MDKDASTEISCKGITKVFGSGPTRVEALRGIDLTIRAGELLMIVGPSGSGKTTFISILAGILSLTEGECKVFGENFNTLEKAKLTQFRGQNIGFVFQSFNLVPMLTSKENVAIPLLLNGFSYENAMQMAEEMLISYGLKDKVDEPPENLSGGQQQRVAIARSCIHKPRLIVCDEPTSNLDHETGKKVIDLLRKDVLEKNRVLIIVTHDARIFSFADRIVKLEDGLVIDDYLN